MIAFLRGILEELTPEYVVVDVNGVGYLVYVPVHIFEDRERFVKGEEITLYTSMQVKEADVSLYGFADADEKKLFQQLILVNGVGPKVAMAILSAMDPDQLRYAVIMEDAKMIAKTPGLGVKTAQKIILELKDKFNKEDLLKNVAETEPAAAPAGKVASGNGAKEALQDTILALEALGYGHAESVKAARSAAALAGEDVTSEDLLKIALKQM